MDVETPDAVRVEEGLEGGRGVERDFGDATWYAAVRDNAEPARGAASEVEVAVGAGVKGAGAGLRAESTLPIRACRVSRDTELVREGAVLGRRDGFREGRENDVCLDGAAEGGKGIIAASSCLAPCPTSDAEAVWCPALANNDGGTPTLSTFPVSRNLDQCVGLPGDSSSSAPSTHASSPPLVDEEIDNGLVGLLPAFPLPLNVELRLEMENHEDGRDDRLLFSLASVERARGRGRAGGYDSASASCPVVPIFESPLPLGSGVSARPGERAGEDVAPVLAWDNAACALLVPLVLENAE